MKKDRVVPHGTDNVTVIPQTEASETEVSATGVSDNMDAAQESGVNMADAAARVDAGHSVEWYIAEYTRLDAVGFDSEWKRGELLVEAKDELPKKQFERFIGVVLGQSLRHAQRWIKVVNTFKPLIDEKKTTVEHLGNVGMTKLFVIATSLAKDQWAVDTSGTILVRNDEDSPWTFAHASTVASIDGLAIKAADPLAAMNDAIAEFRKIAEYGSDAWRSSLRSLYEDHGKGIEKRIEALNAEITKVDTALSTLEAEKDDLEDIKGLIDTFTSDARRELDAAKAENARLQEQVQELLASQHETRQQVVGSDIESPAPMTF
jgi:hypothetical protein